MKSVPKKAEKMPEAKIAKEALTKDDSSAYHVPNLERALQIMELLAKHPAGLGLSEISTMLGISKNSTFRIAMTLLSFQYINRDERSKQFSLSGKLLWLGYSAVNEQNLVEKSFDIMHDLRDLVQETVLIGVLLGDQGTVLEQVPGTYSIKFLVDPGAHFPLHTAAPSKAILAFTPEPSQKKIVDAIDFKVFNKKTITGKRKFYEVLSNTRAMGYGIDLGEEIEGIHCVAAPIFNRHGFPTAAIWTTGPAERMPVNKIHQIAEIVSRHARLISQRLGYFNDQQ